MSKIAYYCHWFFMIFQRLLCVHIGCTRRTVNVWGDDDDNDWISQLLASDDDDVMFVHQQADESLNFEEQILEAAKSIATATAALVKAASVAQRELVEQGKASIIYKYTYYKMVQKHKHYR